MTGSFRMTRRAALAGAVGVALSAPMINRGTYAFAAAPAKIYSRRAVDLVASSLVLDMLAPLKLTMSPDYVAHRLRSEEHTSELQSLMRISYAVFCLKQRQILVLVKITEVSVGHSSTPCITH